MRRSTIWPHEEKAGGVSQRQNGKFMSQSPQPNPHSMTVQHKTNKLPASLTRGVSPVDGPAPPGVFKRKKMYQRNLDKTTIEHSAPAFDDSGFEGQDGRNKMGNMNKTLGAIKSPKGGVSGI